MTKIIIILHLLLLLAAPAAALAGSATSMWDLTIGGYVKLEMDYTDQGRHGSGAYRDPNGKEGITSGYSSGSRINFLTRGPEAWGAKTSAFVEGDFNGVYAGAPRGSFAMRHAFMTFDWPQTKLVIGHTFQKWGFLPTYANMITSGNDLTPFVKGSRQPMIRVERKFAKDWNLSFALLSPTNTLGSNRSMTDTGVVDGFTASQMPFYETSLGWSSDRWGTIGSWKLQWNIDAFYGQEKRWATQYTGPAGAPTSITYAYKDVDSWGLALKGFVPIVSQKPSGKAGALSVSGILFVAQNPSWLQSRAYSAGSYARPSDLTTPPSQPAGQTPDFVAPKMYGGWGQISYHLTDRLFVSGWYGYLRNDTSSAYDAAKTSLTSRFAHANTVQNATQYIVSLCYDVNDSVRFATEYAYFATRYANYGTVPDPSGLGVIPTLSKDATLHSFRVAAWYFF